MLYVLHRHCLGNKASKIREDFNIHWKNHNCLGCVATH